MDFKQLRSFVSVVSYGSFTTAADKLGISQPTVSTHVRMLEEEVGTPLVLRNAKRVELTENGYKMYDQALALLSMHDRLLQSMRQGRSDAVYLGASSMPSGYVLPPILASFCESEPDVRFFISQETSQSVVDGMLTGFYDLGFVGMPVKEDTLECLPFYDDKIVVVTPCNQHYRSIDPADEDAIVRMLEREHVVMRKGGSATLATSNKILEALGLNEASMNVVAHLDDQEAIKNLVENGFGISLMSECAIVERVESGRLCSFDIPRVDASRKFYLLRRKNVELSRRAEKFCSFVLAQAAS